MRKIILIFSIIFLYSCSDFKPSPKYHYINEKAIVAGLGSNDDITQDKFHNPISVKTALIRLVKDTTKYIELSDRHSSYGILTIDNEWYYNHRIGDTVYFKYILKDRFFTIKNKRK